MLRELRKGTASLLMLNLASSAAHVLPQARRGDYDEHIPTAYLLSKKRTLDPEDCMVMDVGKYLLMLLHGNDFDPRAPRRRRFNRIVQRAATRRWT